MDTLFRWIRDFFARLRRIFFGYGDYREPWRWDPGGQRWVYGPSEGTGHKSYNCFEYVIARIESRPPKWGPPDANVADTTTIIARLGALGWIEREGGCNCGCRDGQNKNCAVVFVENGTPFHAMTFDHVHCDWGGKLNAGLPIARFQRPVDYLGGRVPAGVVMRFFCPRRPGEGDGPPVVAPPAGGQKTDEWLHDRAAPQ